MDLRLVIAGILQAPPKMVDEITTWVLASVAGAEVSRLEALLGGVSESTQNLQGRLAEAEVAFATFEKNPASWKAYSAFYEALWVFGHPGGRWSIKEFQKLTPESKQALEAKSLSAVASARGRAERTLQENTQWVRQQKAEIQALLSKARGYLASGVVALDQKATHNFQVDLNGWDYWTPDTKAKVEDRIRAKSQSLLDQIERGKDKIPADFYKKLIDIYRERIANPQAEWQTVKVVLSTNLAKGLGGHWDSIHHTISLLAPSSFREAAIQELQNTIRHELQHFAQSYLQWMLDYEFEAGPGLQEDPHTAIQPDNVPKAPWVRCQRSPRSSDQVAPTRPEHP